MKFSITAELWGFLPKSITSSLIKKWLILIVLIIISAIIVYRPKINEIWKNLWKNLIRYTAGFIQVLAISLFLIVFFYSDLRWWYQIGVFVTAYILFFIADEIKK